MSLLGSIIKGTASIIGGKKAAKAQRKAQEQIIGLQREQMGEQRALYDQSRADLQPIQNAGYQTLGTMVSGLTPGGDFNRAFTMQDFAADPGYEFRMQEGQRGLESAASARGGLLSGGTLKALERYRQGMGAQEYGAAYDRWRSNTADRFARLSDVAGMGQGAVNAGIGLTKAFSDDQANARGEMGSAYGAIGDVRATYQRNKWDNFGQMGSSIANAVPGSKSIGGFIKKIGTGV